MNYPIVEIFSSLQGEGTHTGRPMTFVRFAGCNVGRAPVSVETSSQQGKELLPILNRPEVGSGYTICESVFGQQFGCDTNYHPVRSLSLEQVVSEVIGMQNNRVCFTGGEPLLQNLRPIYEGVFASNEDAEFHIETSGTIEIPRWMISAVEPRVWIALSPKKATVPENIAAADELRLLVSPDMGEPLDVASMLSNWLLKMNSIVKIANNDDLFGLPYGEIYICPVNKTDAVVKDGSAYALEVARLLKKFDARVNVQLHKMLNMR